MTVAESAIGQGDAHVEREGFWPHGFVNQSADARARRATDASRLTFSLPMVVGIVGFFLSMVGAFWIATAGSRSDIRDILTKMTDGQAINETRDKLDEERAKNLRDQITALHEQISASDKRTELLRLELQQLREQVLFRKAGS